MKLQICTAVNNIIEDKTGQSIATCWGSQKKKKALAKELVRRWNAFEKDGLVDDLLEACKGFCQKISDYGRVSHPDSIAVWHHNQKFKEEILTEFEAAIAKCS